jgi:hypothetical protein
MHFVNEHHKVMTKNLTMGFVDHRNIGLAPNRVSELALHHRKRGFNVAALVVVLQEFFAVVYEVVEHALIGPPVRGGNVTE